MQVTVTTKYTILRDSLRRPTVTICEILAGGDTGVGIAIRSPHDNPVEKVGRIKAWGRARKAWIRQQDSLPINRDEAIKSIKSVHPGKNHWDMRHKSQWKAG